MFGLRRSQQLTHFLAGTVAAGIRLRAMLVDSLRLTGNDAEQFAEILHKTTPDLSRDSQPIKQWSELFRRRTSLARMCLLNRPVQQAQIVRR